MFSVDHEGFNELRLYAFVGVGVALPSSRAID